MKIRAQAIRNAARFIETQHGAEKLQRVLSGCSPVVRERASTEIAVAWHPQAELTELLAAAERVLGNGDGRIAEAIGAAGARSNTRGALLSAAFYLARPSFLMKRIADAWRHYNDEGEMRVLSVGDHVASIEVVGMSEPDWLFCCTITGWASEIARRFGRAEGFATHSSCRATGGSRCVWDVSWG